MMTIRPLTADDVVAIRRLVAESVGEGFRFLGRLLADLGLNGIALDKSRQFFLGLFEDGELLAIGGVTPDPYTDRPDIGRLRHVFVTGAARRHGVGRALLGALESRACLAFGVLRLRTDTEAAARFYERLGYERTSQPDATHLRVLGVSQPDLP